MGNEGGNQDCGTGPCNHLAPGDLDPVDEEGDLEPGEYEIRAKVDNFILCADQAHDGQIIGLPSGGEGCTFFVEKPAEPAEDEPPIYRIRAKSSGKYLRESASGDQMISAGFDPSSDSLGMSQFHVERYSTGVYRIQVVGDARFVHFDGSSDPAVQVDHLLSTRGQLDTDQTHFLLEKVTSYPAAAPTETKPTSREIVGFRKVENKHGFADSALEPAVQVHSLEACVTKCTALASCVAFTHEPATHTCMLFDQSAVSSFVMGSGQMRT